MLRPSLCARYSANDQRTSMFGGNFRVTVRQILHQTWLSIARVLIQEGLDDLTVDTARNLLGGAGCIARIWYSTLWWRAGALVILWRGSHLRTSTRIKGDVTWLQRWVPVVYPHIPGLLLKSTSSANVSRHVRARNQHSTKCTRNGRMSVIHDGWSATERRRLCSFPVSILITFQRQWICDATYMYNHIRWSDLITPATVKTDDENFNLGNDVNGVSKLNFSHSFCLYDENSQIMVTVLWRK